MSLSNRKTLPDMALEAALKRIRSLIRQNEAQRREIERLQRLLKYYETR